MEESSRNVWEGSLGAAIDRLQENLSAAGYARENTAEYIRAARHFCYWYAGHASLGAVDESTVEAFLRHRPSCTCPVMRWSHRHYRAGVKHFLAVLRQMGLAPQIEKTVLPEDEVLEAFLEHMTKVRGATDTSAWVYVQHLRPFLQSIYTGGKFPFSALTARDVEAWVARRAERCKPVKVLSRLFKGKFLSFLKKANEAGRLQGVDTTLLNLLYTKKWVVYAKPPFNGPGTVLGYLGRYTHRIAITNHRILGMEEGKVSFSWKDYADGNKTKIMTLAVFEFIRRFLLHVLPHGFVKIRHFGFLSNRNRKAALELCRSLLGVANPEPAPSESWQASLLRITGIDVTRCPLCQGAMQRKQLYRGPP